MGCLQRSPEPFGAGGAYVVFCLERFSEVLLRIYSEDGVLVREMNTGKWNKGQHQYFFDGLDRDKRALKPGRYLYNIEAEDASGALDKRQSVFTRKREKQRWR